VASISTDKNGNRAIQFISPDRKRKTIRLGKISLSIARRISGHVEELNGANIMQESPCRRTAEWVADLKDDMAKKLSAVGLITPRAERGDSTLGIFLAVYLAGRLDVKPATKEVWSQTVRNLQEHFGSDRDLTTITEGDAEGFKMWLIEQDLSVTTVHKRLQFARMLFKAARKRKLIGDNPFADVKSSAMDNEARQHYVTVEATEALLKAANPTWRTIIALARYGGLRCPSEVLSLPWRNVNWDTNRIVVESPKTAHHPGKGSRVIPLFARLRPYLQEAWDLAPDGAEFVVDGRYRDKALTSKGWRNCNLRTQFERIITGAGLEAWPRLFHSLRGSCATDLVNETNGRLHVVAKWLGHNPKIAMKHYLMANDEDFARAAECGAVLDGDGQQPKEKTATTE
jgi:integrase